jgi:hypothetical protein
VTGALVQDLEFNALACLRQGPASPAQVLDRKREGPPIQEELSEWSARDQSQSGVTGLTGNGDALTINLDFNGPTIDQHDVLHTGSSTVTVST